MHRPGDGGRRQCSKAAHHNTLDSERALMSMHAGRQCPCTASTAYQIDNGNMDADTCRWICRIILSLCALISSGRSKDMFGFAFNIIPVAAASYVNWPASRRIPSYRHKTMHFYASQKNGICLSADIIKCHLHYVAQCHGINTMIVVGLGL